MANTPVIVKWCPGMDVIDKLRRPRRDRLACGDRSRQDGEGASRIRHQVIGGGTGRDPRFRFAAALLLDVVDLHAGGPRAG